MLRFYLTSQHTLDRNETFSRILFRPVDPFRTVISREIDIFENNGHSIVVCGMCSHVCHFIAYQIRRDTIFQMSVNYVTYFPRIRNFNYLNNLNVSDHIAYDFNEELKLISMSVE